MANAVLQLDTVALLLTGARARMSVKGTTGRSIVGAVRHAITIFLVDVAVRTVLSSPSDRTRGPATQR